jgi:hypothetical protein
LKPKAAPQPLPFPVIAKPAIPHLRVRSEQEPGVRLKTEALKQNGLAKPLISALAVVVISGGGFFVFRILTNRSQPSSAVPAKAAPAVVSPATKPGPTPSATLNAVAAAPARAIAKAKDVIAAAERRAVTEEKIDSLEGNSPKAERPVSVALTQRPPLPPAIAKPTLVPVTSTSQLAPGVSANTVVKVAGEASQQVRSWVASAKISGLFAGTPPRMLINGRMVLGGQIADDALEITFAGIDPKSKMLVFRDKNGATVSRKF